MARQRVRSVTHCYSRPYSAIFRVTQRQINQLFNVARFRCRRVGVLAHSLQNDERINWRGINIHYSAIV